MGDSINNLVNSIVEEYKEKTEKFDPNGSYTGINVEEDEKPIQDADDL